MYKYKINSPFFNFESFILSIRNHFSENNNSIHKARNELKIITHKNEALVVKSFKIPNFIRRVYYTFFRETKAKKSYDYSLKIGEFTPEPIAYIEFYNNALLSDSYYIAKKFEYDFTIREPLIDADFEDKEKIFQEFAKFSYALHQKNIYHLDYSPGNILIKKEDDGFLFKIVDVNRMLFKTLSLDERLKNFSKLWAKNEDLETIVKSYAQLINNDEKICIDKALAYSQEHKYKKNIKKRLKGKKVVD